MRKIVLLTVVTAACAGTGGGGGAADADSGGAQVIEQPEVALTCRTQPGSEAVAQRKSTFDSTRIALGSYAAQICYSRPAAQGRTIFGEAPAAGTVAPTSAPLVPYGKLWRTGANEPTILHVPVNAELAGIALAPGSYSLYTIPGATEWTVIVNRSTSQWGHEARYTPEVAAQEVGRAQVPTERMDQHVERFTIRTEPAAGGTDLLLEWERTRVRIPVKATS